MLRRDVAQGVRRGVQAVNSKTAVLIIGGGPVGLALAVELGWRGIACTLVEQTDGTISTPKMNEVNVRTMEFCRRWGIAEAVQNCPFPADYPVDVVFVTNLAGYELGRVPRAARNSAQPEPFSPARFQVCSQIWFDPILRSFAGSLATVELLYRHRLEDFEHSETGVVARVVDLATGVSKRLAADYMVGATAPTAWCVRRSASSSSAPERSAIRCTCFSARPTCWNASAVRRVPSSSRLTATACGAACASSILRTAYGA
jgi:2-polyprenyl-6-methoxyphenol hydroxylase and related FAD-dependent oxidoreductases